MRLQLNKMINKYFVLQPVWSTCIEKQLSKMAAGGYDLVGINALIWLSQLSFERCSPKSQRYFVYTVCDTRSRRHLNAFQCAKDSILPYCETLYCDGCNGVQREHNKKLNNGLPILHKVPPKRDYRRYFCIMAEKGGTSHGGLTDVVGEIPRDR